MTAAATPTKYDAKPLALVQNLSTTANTVIYTAPNERGVRVKVTVSNSTTTPCTLTLSYKDIPGTFVAANTNVPFWNSFNVPGDGSPIVWEFTLGAQAALSGSAGTASALNVLVEGIEMAT